MSLSPKGSTGNRMALQFRAAKAPRSLLFRGMNEQDIDSILKAGRPARIDAHVEITKQGDDGKRFYFLWSGRARHFFETRNGKKLISIWITPGDTIGSVAFTPEPSLYNISSETVQDSLFLVWDRATIRTLCKRFPPFLDGVLRIAYECVHWYVAAHACLAASTAQERLAQVFAILGPQIGEEVSDGYAIDVTNEELADSAVLTPFTVSRILGAWKKVGAISRRRGTVVVHSPEKLFGEIPSSEQSRLDTSGRGSRHSVLRDKFSSKA